MKPVLIVVLVVVAVSVASYFFLQETDAGRRFKLGLLRARAEIDPTPENIGQLAAAEVRLRPDLVPPARSLTPAQKEAIRADTRRRLGQFGAPVRVPGSPVGGPVIDARRIADELIRKAEGIDEYGRPPHEQQAAIAAAVAGDVARGEGLTPDEINESANVAVREFGFPNVGHVTLVLTGRADWAAAILAMVAVITGTIAAAATGGAAAAIITGAVGTAGAATQ